MTSASDMMPGIQRACSYWKDAGNLQRVCGDLATAFDAGMDSTVDKAKAIIETVCITILTELGKGLDKDMGVGELLSETTKALGINGTGTSQFQRIVSQHNKLAESINDFRNKDGVVSHGRDGFLDPLTEYHRRAALLAADSVVSFLFEAYRGMAPNLQHTREPYERFDHLNQRIDDAVYVEPEIDDDTGALNLTVKSGGQELFKFNTSASQLLYEIDRKAYIEVLLSVGQQVAKEPEEEFETEEKTEPKPEPLKKESVSKDGRIDINRFLKPIEEYKGQYQDKQFPLYDVLVYGVGLGAHMAVDDINKLAMTILNGFENIAGTDWYSHQSSRARIRTFLKRLVKVFEIKKESSEKFVNQIEEWLRIRLSD